MKIVIVTPYAEPEKGACILRMNEFKRHFTKEGHSVVFLAPTRPGVKQENGVKRYRSRRGLLSLVRELDFDVLIGTSPPMTNSFIAMLVAKLRGKPVVLDVRDPWTYEAEGLGIYKKFNPKLLLYKLIERISYKIADRIFSVTDFTSRILEREGAAKDKIVLVPNGTIPRIFKRDEKQGSLIRKKLGIPKNAIVLLYAGAFVKKDLDKMLKNLSDEIKRENVYVLLLLSAEPTMKHEWNKLKKFIEHLGIYKKTFFVDLPKIDYKDVHKYFSAADFGLNPLPESMDYCIPAKTYDYLACGLPIIAKGPKKSELRDFITKNAVGWYLSSETELQRNFLKMINNMKNPNSKIELSLFAKKKFDRTKSAKIALNEIINLFDKKENQ